MEKNRLALNRLEIENMPGGEPSMTMKHTSPPLYIVYGSALHLCTGKME